MCNNVLYATKLHAPANFGWKIYKGIDKISENTGFIL